MSHLSQLKLENFRGFEHLQISFEPDVTVLVGANGSGKSSVLDAVRLALRSVTNVELGEPRDIRSGSDQAFLSVLHGSTPIEVVLLRHDGDASVVLERAKRPLRDWESGALIFFTTRRSVADATPGATTGQQWGRSQSLRSWWNAHEGLDQFFIWFREMEDLENEHFRENGHPLPELEAVRAAVGRVLDGVTNVRVRRRFPPFSNGPVLTVTKEDQELPFDTLSEGERVMVLLVADIARRLILYDTDAGLETPGLLLIDEIEQHLHPGWQRRVLGKLREVFRNLQIITTTHSPIVLSELESRQIRVLENFQLVEVHHGKGRSVEDVLESTLGTSARPEETESRFDTLAEKVDDGALDEASAILESLEAQLGADADVTYYRAIIDRLKLEAS